MICSKGQRVEFDNPADYYNTVLKMAKKRAHVDAILTATAASDCFTQDVEDTQREKQRPAGRPAPQRREEPEQPAAEPVQAGNGDALITRTAGHAPITPSPRRRLVCQGGFKALIRRPFRIHVEHGSYFQERHYNAIIEVVHRGSAHRPRKRQIDELPEVLWVWVVDWAG